LSAEGSQELLRVFSNYEKELRRILIENRETRRRSQRKIEVRQIIKELGLSELENDLGFVDK
jgi:hypothetical protein